MNHLIFCCALCVTSLCGWSAQLTEQNAIQNIQNQIETVQQMCSKQMTEQATTHQKTISDLRSDVQKQIARLEDELQKMQNILSLQIQKLQKQMAQLSVMK